MDFSVLAIFCLVYLGMILGNLPGLSLDRTGIALLGAIAMIEFQKLSLQETISGVDISTIAILFSFMIISAQFYFSGFYTLIAARMEKCKIAPREFLLVVIVVSGILSAVLINDVVCLAMAPLLINICQKRNINPIPFLLGLAAGSNIGSALTLVGNPQNILIGQALNVPFANYSLDALVPCFLGFLVAWRIISAQAKGKWILESEPISIESPKYNPWQSYKGILAIFALITCFLFLDLPRDHLSLAAAGFLLISHRTASKVILKSVDWQLLVLFLSLFIVNYQFNQSEMVQKLLNFFEGYQLNLQSEGAIFFLSLFLTNLISNVPAVLLLIPFATAETASSLALYSTFAGNILIVGSIATIIVVTQASNYGISISWKKHAASGLPIGLITLGIAAFWLFLRHNSFFLSS